MLKLVAATGALVQLISAAATSGATAQEEDKSIWDGVYTEEQADRGQKVNSGLCAKCHGTRGDGANEPDQPGGPAIARFSFLRKWENTSLASLFEYIRTEMPPDNPGSRTDQEYIDALAYMLVMSGAPPGDTELTTDPETLDRIYIEQKPE
jgi:cytochrome c